MQFIRKFAPKKFNKFEFLPSIGASSGMIILWNGSLFNGTIEFQNEFSLSVRFSSNLSLDSWILTNIYGPCHTERKAIFLDWFSNISMADDTDWIVMGDFNFIRSPNDRNKPGGDVNDMLLFNDAISNLELVELPLKGRNSPGVTCKKNHSLKDWIGFSPLHDGPCHTPQPWFTLYQSQLLIMSLVWLPLVQKFQEPKFSDLKITG
jgi:hypothetical protein